MTRRCIVHSVFQSALGLSLLLASACGETSEQAPDENNNSAHPATDETPWEDQWTLWEDFEGSSTGGWMATIEGEWDQSASSLVKNEPPRGQSHQALLLNIPDDSEAAYIWHHHFSPLEQMSALRFWARTGEAGPQEVLFAMTGLTAESSTYADAQLTQRPFRVKRLTLSEEWQEYTVLFDELKAESEGEPQALYDSGGFLLRIIVPQGPAGQLWFDDIEMGCTEGALCSQRQ